MDDIFWRLLPWSSLGLILVLLLRRPACRLFGASPAFLLWLLPIAFCALPWLPSERLVAVLPPLRVVPDGASLLAARMPMPLLGLGLGSLWLAGVAACLLRLSTHYVHIRMTSKHLAQPLPDLGNFAPARVRIADIGPAVLWAPRPLLLLPEDFLTRFDANERACVLRHELTHLRRGDAWWSLFAELVFSLLWFHPLAWIALPRFRLDQELACDERSLRDAPEQRAHYAHALLHSAGVSFAPAITPWLTHPQLKERLRMIQQVAFGVSRRRLGYLVIGLVMSGSAMIAQAAAQHAPQGATADAQFNIKHAPAYPQEAIANKEQGIVMLDVVVDTQGHPKTIHYDATHSTTTSTDLIKAASDAAAQWRFFPAMRNGQAIESATRVPVQFDLSETPDTPSSSNS
ncbi:MAG TPA: M56 family metallopeptidase [Dyella sp.]|uniref:M56 family metallopeptidase n=1 Tax=Dyella sp. TaxID=1869338 RepID=UPI002F924ACA